MHGKLFATVLVGIAIGLALPFLGKLQDAMAQPEKAPRQERAAKWEYQVVSFQPGNDMTQMMNRLAGEEWEYVGLVAISGGGKTAGEVAFKRPKRLEQIPFAPKKNANE